MPVYHTTAYRYPFERLILTGTVALVLTVIAVSATVTLSLAAIFILLMVGFTYLANRTQHESILKRSYPIDARSSTELISLARSCLARVQPGAVKIYVAPSAHINAYTFGLSSPKVIVLYSSLFDLMDADELRFVLGHEMGHVSLGHTWLNSLLGGMAGIPAPFGASILLNASFLWWNRACEYSADRAGLLACGSPARAITALVKLGTGSKVESKAEMDRALRLIEAQDDTLADRLAEALSTHPMILRRIQALQRYAASSQYKRLQEKVNQNPM